VQPVDLEISRVVIAQIWCQSKKKKKSRKHNFSNNDTAEKKTRNRLYFKKTNRKTGVAMSELSNGIKKHTSKSRETIPLRKKYIIRF
jgi:hypothetical protein